MNIYFKIERGQEFSVEQLQLGDKNEWQVHNMEQCSTLALLFIIIQGTRALILYQFSYNPYSSPLPNYIIYFLNE